MREQAVLSKLLLIPYIIVEFICRQVSPYWYEVIRILWLFHSLPTPTNHIAFAKCARLAFVNHSDGKIPQVGECNLSMQIQIVVSKFQFRRNFFRQLRFTVPFVIPANSGDIQSDSRQANATRRDK